MMTPGSCEDNSLLVSSIGVVFKYKRELHAEVPEKGASCWNKVYIQTPTKHQRKRFSQERLQPFSSSHHLPFCCVFNTSESHLRGRWSAISK